jgi:hypothetical protein
MNNNSSSAGDYLADFLHKIVAGLPAFLGAVLVLIVGYIIAKVLAKIVYAALDRAGLDRHLHSGKGGNIIQRAVPSPTSLMANLVFWFVFFLAVSMAVSVLGIPALVDLVRGIYSYIPNVIAALLIFMVAGAISAAVSTLVVNTMGDTPTGKVVATAAPILVMGIAIFMILNQLKIAPAIVTITYAALIGSAALGMALAFGLGGRDVAGRILGNLYEKGQQHKGTVAADFQKGGRTAKRRADDLPTS